MAANEKLLMDNEELKARLAVQLGAVGGKVTEGTILTAKGNVYKYNYGDEQDAGQFGAG